MNLSPFGVLGGGVQAVPTVLTVLMLGCSPDGVPAGGSDDGNETETASSTETNGGDGTEDDETTDSPLDESDTETDEGVETCGNGELDPDEVCDDGINDGSYGGCAADCSEFGPHCGDSEIQAEHETCDEGRDNGTAACNVVCQIPGTLLDERLELIPADPVQPRGARATLWNDQLTLVVGGWVTSVWRIDPESRETVDLGLTDEEVFEVSGALGLDTGELLVAGGSGNEAKRFNEQLQSTWSYQNVDNADGFVGLAPISGGAILAALHVNHIAQNTYSAFYVIGLTNTGASLWNAIEVVQGTSDFYARDMRGLPGGRGVLLTDTLGGSRAFRIYNAQGNVDKEVELPQLVGAFRTLCHGEAGFFLLGSQMTLVGFDAAGNGTFSTSFQPVSPGQTMAVGCAALKDNSPIVAISRYQDDSSTILDVIGFAGAVPVWQESLPLNGYSQEQPEIFVDHARSVVWVFTAGQTPQSERFHYAAVFAI